MLKLKLQPPTPYLSNQVFWTELIQETTSLLQNSQPTSRCRSGNISVIQQEMQFRFSLLQYFCIDSIFGGGETTNYSINGTHI